VGLLACLYGLCIREFFERNWAWVEWRKQKKEKKEKDRLKSIRKGPHF